MGLSISGKALGALLDEFLAKLQNRIKSYSSTFYVFAPNSLGNSGEETNLNSNRYIMANMVLNRQVRIVAVCSRKIIKQLLGVRRSPARMIRNP